MIIFIESLNKIIGFITFISFFTMMFSGLIEGAGNIKMSFKDFKNTICFKYALLSTILSFLMLFLSAEYFKSLIRDEISLKFENVDFKTSIFYVNDTLTQNNFLINSIKNIDKDFNQRLEKRSLKVKLVKKNEVILLDLAKSTQDSTQYGVYYPKYSLSNANCIGFIKFKK